MASLLFDPAIAGSDWSLAYNLGGGILVGDTWGVNDHVVVAFTNDQVRWDDYGLVQGVVGVLGSLLRPPALVLTDQDLTGRVTKIAPRTVLIKLKAADTRLLGAGTVNLGAAVENIPNGTRNVFLTGRLPIQYGAV
jgi:hypothetical protein